MSLVAEAKSLMLHQFENSPNLNALVGALVKPLQSLADEIERLGDGRYISAAQDNRLDILGRLVGQARLGMSDEDFKAWIKVRILLNRSSGTMENVFEILAVLFGPKPPIWINEYKPNDVVAIFFIPVKMTAVFGIIRAALPLANHCHFMRADFAPTFRFDTSSFSESHFAEFYEENRQ